MAQAGRQIIGYLVWVMDGEMPAVGEWQDLWLEAYQLLGMVYMGALRLEHSLELTEQWYLMSHLDLSSIPRVLYIILYVIYCVYSPAVEFMVQ